MASNALKNVQTLDLPVSRAAMTDDDRKASAELLDAAMETDNPETATRLRVVAALLHGQDIQKIRRNLSVPEKMILAYKAKFDAKGLQGLIFSPFIISSDLQR